MNRRKMAPGHDANIVDEFGNEERILEHAAEDFDAEVVKIVIPEDRLLSHVEMFPTETAHAHTHRSTVLDVSELSLKGAVPRTALPRRNAVAVVHSRQRLLNQRVIRRVGILTIAVALVLAAGAVLSRLDMTALLDDLTANGAGAPAVLEVRPQSEKPPAAAAVPVAEPIDRRVVAPGPAAVAPAAPAVAVARPLAVVPPSPNRAQPTRPPPRQAASRAVARPAPRETTPPRRAQPAPLRPAANATAPAITAGRGEPSRPVEQPRTVSSTPPETQVGGVGSSPPAATGASVPLAAAATPPPAVAPVNSAPAVPSPNPGAPAAPGSGTPSPSSRPPTASAPATPGLTTDTRAVALALNRYQQAFSALDANAAHAVWPSVDVKALAKAFDQLEEQTFDLEGCNIALAGARAEADCNGNARYIRKVGSRALRVEPRRWHFTLRQNGDQWVIDTVNAR